MPRENVIDTRVEDRDGRKVVVETSEDVRERSSLEHTKRILERRLADIQGQLDDVNAMIEQLDADESRD